MSPSGPFSVTAHPFESETRGSHAYEIGPSSASNALVLIGGLTDGPHTSAHARVIAQHFEEAKDISYSLFEIRMRSSYIGFGTSSLANDVEDIAALVKYLRSIGKDKIVLFGCSTGCQDCISYSNYAKYNNPPVDGFIMQGPISDRESLEIMGSDMQPCIELALKMIKEGKKEDCLPNGALPIQLGAPISAYRFWSLAAKGGDDDFFSSDFDNETINKNWSVFDKPVLVLHSEKDEFVPERINQTALNDKYKAANPAVSSLSGLIPGASHAVEQPEAQEWLAKRIVDFLATV